MPKWICKGCNHEFWGWGAYHRFKTGDRLICPDCHGDLVKKLDETTVIGIRATDGTLTAAHIWKPTGLQ